MSLAATTAALLRARPTSDLEWSFGSGIRHFGVNKFHSLRRITCEDEGCFSVPIVWLLGHS